MPVLCLKMVLVLSYVSPTMVLPWHGTDHQPAAPIAALNAAFVTSNRGSAGRINMIELFFIYDIYIIFVENLLKCEVRFIVCSIVQRCLYMVLVRYEAAFALPVLVFKYLSVASHIPPLDGAQVVFVNMNRQSAL